MTCDPHGATRLLRLAAAFAAAAALGACASRLKPLPLAPSRAPTAPSTGGPLYAPGSPVGPVDSRPLAGTERDFVVNVGDRVYFDVDQYEILSDKAPVLEAQAIWLNRYPQVRVRIEGNADERGTREYNFALGARRAYAVKAFLQAHGVDGARITTVSYGKERPIDPGEGEAAWRRNRNAHTAIVAGAREPERGIDYWRSRAGMAMPANPEGQGAGSPAPH